MGVVWFVLLTTVSTAATTERTALREIPDAFFAAHCQLGPLEEHLFDDAADGRLDDHSLLEAALVASGVEDADVLTQYQGRIHELAVELWQSGRFNGTPRQRAEVLFEFMHQNVLRGGYDLRCTDLRIALDKGRYNCVSASVLFNCLAGEMGLTTCGLELPGHAMSRVSFPDGAIDVETTCPQWFRLMNDPKKQAETVEKTLGRAVGKRAVGDRAEAREVAPLQLAAMVYYNRGVDLLAVENFATATEVNTKAARLDPMNATTHANLLATLNNWAIARGNAGRYAEAVAILREALDLDPAYETFAKNYSHVYRQWAEHLRTRGQFEEALDVLANATPPLPEPDVQRVQIEIYQHWAYSLQKGDRTNEAMVVLDRAIARHPNADRLRRQRLYLTIPSP